LPSSQGSDRTLASFDIEQPSNLKTEVSTPSGLFKLQPVIPVTIVSSNPIVIRSGAGTAAGIQCQTLRSAKHQKVASTQREERISNSKVIGWYFWKRCTGRDKLYEEGTGTA
ncbi:MAG: hypothetical protein L6R42_004765, partial [Xanthoria sp. 1 TBL-2021]